MSSILRGLGSLIALLAALVGVPALLVTIGRLGALGSVNWSRVFTTPDDGSLLLGLVTLVAWLAWAVVALTIVLEIVSIASRGAISLRLPGTGWLRPAVASLILSIGALVVAAPHLSAPGEDAKPTTLTADAVAPASSPEHQDESQPHAAQRHAVVAGDDLWSLSEHYLGDGASWRIIADANPWLNPAARLEPGSVLVIPSHPEAATTLADSITAQTGTTPQAGPQGDQQAPAPEGPSSPVAPAPEPRPPEAGHPTPDAARPDAGVSREVVVGRGDTLWSIAEEHLGDPWRWREIYELNTSLIEDPDQIDIGWRLRLPAASPAPAPEPPAPEPPAAGEEPAPGDSAPEAPTADRHAPAPGDEAIQPGPTTDPVPTATGQAPTSTGQVPAPAEGTPESSRTGAEVPGDAQGGEQAHRDVSGELAAFGGVLAFGVLTFLSRQRVRQLLTRSVGRQVPQVSQEACRLSQALTHRAEPPSGDDPAPAAVLLGWEDDRAVTLDLEEVGLLTIAGNAEHQAGALAAITSSLLTAPWSGEVEQVLVGRHQCWVDQVNDPRVRVSTDPAATIDEIARLVTARRDARLSQPLAELRRDPNLGAAWRPVVFVFAQPLTAQQATRVRDLTAPGCGVSAVVADCGLDFPHTVCYANGQARFEGRTFTAQLISSPARRGLIELFRTAASEETQPAPWWTDPDHLPPNVTRLRWPDSANEERSMTAPSRDTAHPVLLMLGPVTIEGARGTPPSRAPRQCAEYCAWLLTHPGQTATTMTSDLQVAEPTRRSNMSRLRNWLGDSPSGEPYLPDAYSGHIELHPGVTSDWEQFCLLTAGGINRTPTAALRKALSLVRGAPLADAAPWQWQWAENMRTDMVSAIRDAGVVLSEHALALGDLDLSRWAIERATAAVPEDELLLACLARTEHRAGNHDEVRRIALRITRNARQAGLDLHDSTVETLQHVMEGRSRVRQA
ncbi:MAG: LysM peptidoglycan-binding domain-containing protein [Propionibacteriaceae bacterium]|nr:LysM peptidoglycan-binding domain-containing protein [Propionibacteriaceae bacterium]